MTKELKIDYLRELEFARLLVLQEKLKKRSTKSFKRAFLTEGVMRYRDNNLCTTTYHKKSSELSATGNMFGSNHNTFNRQSSPAAPWQSNGFSNPYTFSSPNGFLSPNGFSSANGFSSPLQASSSSKRRLS